MKHTVKTVLASVILWLSLCAALICLSYCFPSLRSVKTMDSRYLCVLILTVAVSVILYRIFGICGAQRVKVTTIKFLIHFLVCAGVTWLDFYLILPASVAEPTQVYNCLINYTIVYTATAIVLIYGMIQKKASSLRVGGSDGAKDTEAAEKS